MHADQRLIAMGTALGAAAFASAPPQPAAGARAPLWDCLTMLAQPDAREEQE